MKYLAIIFFFFLFYSHSYAEEYELIVFSIHSEKSIETLNNYKFKISEVQGNWQDNLGGYGKLTILFFMETVEKEKVTLKGLAVFTDEDNEKFWFQANRKFSLEDAGVGIMHAIDATEKYQHLIGISCNYAIKYFEDRSYMKIKCKI
tara:strand:- start:25 stop:465 length:441 start_codon:yes stop_codon:yes gene_type:complete